MVVVKIFSSKGVKEPKCFDDPSTMAFTPVEIPEDTVDSEEED